MNYSQRTLGNKIRLNENINFTFWEKLTQIFTEMYENDFFSISYPDKYPELDHSYGIESFYAGCIYGCNSKKLSKDLAFISGDVLCWPLQTRKKVLPKEVDENKLPITFENWMPSEYEVFDLIEFLYSKTKTVKTYRNYITEASGEDIEIKTLNVLRDDKSAQINFSKMINTLLRDARMIYEFDSELGQVKTIVSAETKQLTHSALNCGLFFFDLTYQEMLQDACAEISSVRIKESYRALKTLWEAYERLKCYFERENRNKKKVSVQKILNLFSESPEFKVDVELEMERLTKIGNNLQIRHAEPYTENLINRRYINYLFNRCLNMIVLIQDQIVVTERTKAVK